MYYFEKARSAKSDAPGHCACSCFFFGQQVHDMAYDIGDCCGCNCTGISDTDCHQTMELIAP